MPKATGVPCVEVIKIDLTGNVGKKQGGGIFKDVAAIKMTYNEGL